MPYLLFVWLVGGFYLSAETILAHPDFDMRRARCWMEFVGVVPIAVPVLFVLLAVWVGGRVWALAKKVAGAA